jgi:hypothetical protein
VKVKGKWVSDRTLSSWLKAVFLHLAPWAEKQWHLLSDEEWISDSKKNELYPGYEDKLLYFIDGSIIPINDSTSHPCSRAIRNGKSKKPAYVFFVLVSARGRIVHVSRELKEGSVHDKSHCNSDGIAKVLETKYPLGRVEHSGKVWTRGLCGDKAYPFIDTPRFWKLYITKSGEETKDLDENGKETIICAKNSDKLDHVVFDPGCACLRGVVERTIRRIKSWPIFDCSSHVQKALNCLNILKVACGLSNWSLENNEIAQI